MACKCPVCGGRIDSKSGVHVSLEADIAVIEGRVIRLGPALASLLYVLQENAYDFVSTSDLNQAIYGDKWPETNVLYMHISALRKAIAGTGWSIQLRPEKSKKEYSDGKTGYMLVRETDFELNEVRSALKVVGCTDERLAYMMDKIQKGFN